MLLAKGKSKTEIAVLLQAARSSVNRWINWYLTDDIDGLQADLPGRKVRFEPEFIGKLLRFVVGFRPQEFGYQRSRLSSELLSIVLREALNIVLHSSTIRRWLPKHGIVWRRAAQTLCIKDPDKESKLATTINLITESIWLLKQFTVWLHTDLQIPQKALSNPVSYLPP